MSATGGHAALMKGRGAQHQDAALMKSEKPSASVESRVAKRMASRLPRGFSLNARVCTTGMKIQIVGITVAQDADRQIEHLAVTHDFRNRMNPRAASEPQGRAKIFRRRASRDGHDQRKYQRLDHAESRLQRQHQQPRQTCRNTPRRDDQKAISARWQNPKLGRGRKAAMGNSHQGPTEQFRCGGNSARGIACARSRPWQSPAGGKRLKKNRHQARNEHGAQPGVANCEPPPRSVAQLPGSI